MQGNGENRSEELQKKLADARQKAFEEEFGRLDQHTQQRAKELLTAYRSAEEQAFQQRLAQAKSDRQRDEETLRKHEEELGKRFDEEGRRRSEARRRAEEERKRTEEEERRREAELARQKAQEEERKRQEEERKRKEEEARIRAEEERRRRAEELQKQEAEREAKVEADRERKEQDKRRQEDERQERVKTLLGNAQASFSTGDYEHALVEVAKALVNDPANAEALDLEAKIKQAQGKPVEAPTAAPEQKPRQRRRRPAKAITRVQAEKKRTGAPLILALVVLVVVVTIVVIVQVRKSLFAAPPTFAVMPWLSSSAVLEEKIIGSSLAEEMSRRFEYLKPVTVMGYSSSYALSQRTQDPRRSAFQLGYFYALDGVVRQTGDTFTVSLELVDSLGRTAWGRQYLKRSGNLAELASEASRQLAEALHVQVGSDSRAFLDPSPPVVGDAYLLYLRAEEMLHRRTPESLQNAYDLFRQALQADPKFAAASAAAADILITERERTWNMSDSILAQARSLADAAVDANSSLADAYCARGRARAQNKEYKSALEDFGTALKLAPNDGRSYLEKGKVLLKVGKYSEAADALQLAFKFDPRDLDVLETSAILNELVHTPHQGIWYYETALALTDDSTAFLVGPFADAVTGDPDLRLSQGSRVIMACETRMAADPADYYSSYQVARLKQDMGRIEESSALLNKLTTLLQGQLRQRPRDSRAMMYLALTLTRLGKFSEAEALSRKAVELDARNPSVEYLVARMYALQMGSQKKGTDDRKKTEALKALQQAITLQYRLEDVVNPDLFNLYDLPEFHTLIQEPM